MADSTDILLKAAEDVSSGMWCKGAMFRYDADKWGSWYPDEFEHLKPTPTLKQLAESQRCALGSLSLMTLQLGATQADFDEAVQRAVNHLPDYVMQEFEGNAFDSLSSEGALAWFNDTQLPDDPFDAGSKLSDLFRSAATTV